MSHKRAARTTLAVLGAAFTLVTACSLTTDLDGFSSGGLPADGGEGGSLSDVPIVTNPDGGPMREGGSNEAGPTIDGGGGCPQKPIALCEGFDTDETANGWQVITSNGATANVITASGQRGLLLTVPKADVGGSDAIAFWSKAIDKVVSKLSFDVDMIYDQRTLNPSEYHVLFEIRVNKPDAKYTLIYITVPGDTTNGWVIQDFPPGSDTLDYHPIPDAISENVQHHIHWDVAVGGKANLIVDGAIVDSHDTPAFFQPGTVNVSIGVTLSQVPTTPINVGYDNLVFTGE